MPIRISLPQRVSRAFVFALLLAAYALGPAMAADMPLASGSPLSGITFDDQPLSLPVQQNFQMALLTASGELGRSCGKMEAYGWRMKQSEQQRVDQIFNGTVDRLRGLGYVVETQSPNSVSRDVTLFTADRQDRHFIFMWSAGEIGLVMVLCQSSPPLVNHNATTSYPGQVAAPVKSFPKPAEVLSADLKTPVRDKATHEAVQHFSPVGKWVGSYSCAQGYTGGTLTIASLSGKNFKGTFRFYPTAKNPRVPTGSYNVFGQYDHNSHRILINPGKWIKRPHGYADTIIVGDFDPATHSFSGFFQGITGCTSFEAKLSGPSHELGGSKVTKKKVAKKKHAKKSDITAAPNEAPVSVTPAAPIGGAPAPGITVGQPASSASPPLPEPTVTTPAPAATTPVQQPAPQLQPQVPTQTTKPAATAPAASNTPPSEPSSALPSPTAAPMPDTAPPLPSEPVRQ